MSRAALKLLRLGGPRVPGWFPLVVEPLHRRLDGSDTTREVALLGFRMRVDLGEYMQRRFYYHCYEGPEVRFLRRWLRVGDTVVDVGAHVGLFTLLAARLVGPYGRILAFEPVPENFDRLCENIALNAFANVTPERTAVSDEAGEVSLGLNEARLVGTSTCDYAVGGPLGSVTAPATTLDDRLSGLEGRVRLLKFDVEGLEPKVLGGVQHILAERPPEALMFEINHKTLSKNGEDVTELLATVERAGYEVSALWAGSRLRPAPSAAALKAAAARWDSQKEPRSQLRVGLGTRNLVFNAVALLK